MASILILCRQAGEEQGRRLVCVCGSVGPTTRLWKLLTHKRGPTSQLGNSCHETRNDHMTEPVPLRRDSTAQSLLNMSETTQILFNSPALRSLKRDQLVKLCKIHSIKASGKSVDLIQRLKDHAVTLPPDDPLRVTAHTDNESSVLDSKRPSDQWEVVMEDIQEVPEPSRTTLSSLRSVTSNAPDEFGTGGGSKCESTTALNLFIF